jgi:hypothetical protein
MEIKIRRIGTYATKGDPGATDVTTTYRVTDEGNQFEIHFRSHSHGCNLTLAGQEGILYTDRENGTVRRQILAVGRGCGIGIENDELVEGLSPWSIRGVLFAERTGETREITLLIEGPENSEIQPVVLLDGVMAGILDRL